MQCGVCAVCVQCVCVVCGVVCVCVCVCVCVVCGVCCGRNFVLCVAVDTGSLLSVKWPVHNKIIY